MTYANSLAAAVLSISLPLCWTARAEEIGSSQNTSLEPASGQLDKVRPGALVFLDSESRLANLLYPLKSKGITIAFILGISSFCRAVPGSPDSTVCWLTSDLVSATFFNSHHIH